MLFDHAIASNCIRICWLFWLAFWFVTAFTNKRTVYRQPWSQRLSFLLIGVGAFVWMKLVRHPLAQLFPITPVSDVLGMALCIVGLGWSVWARTVLGRNWSGMVTLKENHELIQSGPYRFTRHPIYTGILVALAGTFLVVQPTVLGLVMFLAMIAAFIAKLRQEEALMLRQFAEAYVAYKRRVRAALIPFIW